MNGIEPVRPPPSRTDGHLRLIGAFVAGALLVAIVKPWGSGDQLAAVPLPTPSPRPSDSPAPELGYESRVYDPSIFGTHEPEAIWAIWPTGYLVTFGFVVQVSGVPSPAPGASASPGKGPKPTTAAPPPGATQSPPSGNDVAGVPIWPSRFDVPLGNHLLLIGINMPRGHSVVAVRLARASTAGAASQITTTQLPSPWPDHFVVIGIPTPPEDGRLTVWPPGTYQLDVTFDPGGVTRSIEIRILGPSDTP